MPRNTRALERGRRTSRESTWTVKVQNDAHDRGGRTGPGDISGGEWWDVLRRVARSVAGQDLLGVSAGVAFYAWFAAVFGVVFLVSTYGFIADPETVRSRIEALHGLLPREATRFMADQMRAVAASSKLRLGAGLGGAFLVALWSARAAMATLIAALNIAYREREERLFWHLQAVTLALTAGAVLFGTAALALVALLPVAVDELALGSVTTTVMSVARWPMLAVLMTFALAALYRFAPCRPTPRWRWVSSGAAAATGLWLLGSAGFSFYVENVAAAEAIGALGGVLVLQTWFYITALAVLLGAKLNAETERQDSGADR
jgi:membrane protein